MLFLPLLLSVQLALVAADGFNKAHGKQAAAAKHKRAWEFLDKDRRVKERQFHGKPTATLSRRDYGPSLTSTSSAPSSSSSGVCTTIVQPYARCGGSGQCCSNGYFCEQFGGYSLCNQCDLLDTLPLYAPCGGLLGTCCAQGSTCSGQNGGLGFCLASPPSSSAPPTSTQPPSSTVSSSAPTSSSSSVPNCCPSSNNGWSWSGYWWDPIQNQHHCSYTGGNTCIWDHSGGLCGGSSSGCQQTVASCAVSSTSSVPAPSSSSVPNTSCCPSTCSDGSNFWGYLWDPSANQHHCSYGNGGSIACIYDPFGQSCSGSGPQCSQQAPSCAASSSGLTSAPSTKPVSSTQASSTPVSSSKPVSSSVPTTSSGLTTSTQASSSAPASSSSSVPNTSCCPSTCSDGSSFWGYAWDPIANQHHCSYGNGGGISCYYDPFGHGCGSSGAQCSQQAPSCAVSSSGLTSSTQPVSSTQASSPAVSSSKPASSSQPATSSGLTMSVRSSSAPAPSSSSVPNTSCCPSTCSDGSNFWGYLWDPIANQHRCSYGNGGGISCLYDPFGKTCSGSGSQCSQTAPSCAAASSGLTSSTQPVSSTSPVVSSSKPATSSVPTTSSGLTTSTKASSSAPASSTSSVPNTSCCPSTCSDGSGFWGYAWDPIANQHRCSYGNGGGISCLYDPFGKTCSGSGSQCSQTAPSCAAASSGLTSSTQPVSSTSPVVSSSKPVSSSPPATSSGLTTSVKSSSAPAPSSSSVPNTSCCPSTCSDGSNFWGYLWDPVANQHRCSYGNGGGISCLYDPFGKTCSGSGSQCSQTAPSCAAASSGLTSASSTKAVSSSQATSPAVSSSKPATSTVPGTSSVLTTSTKASSSAPAPSSSSVPNTSCCPSTCSDGSNFWGYLWDPIANQHHCSYGNGGSVSCIYDTSGHTCGGSGSQCSQTAPVCAASSSSSLTSTAVSTNKVSSTSSAATSSATSASRMASSVRASSSSTSSAPPATSSSPATNTSCCPSSCASGQLWSGWSIVNNQHSCTYASGITCNYDPTDGSLCEGSSFLHCSASAPSCANTENVIEQILGNLGNLGNLGGFGIF